MRRVIFPGGLCSLICFFLGAAGLSFGHQGEPESEWAIVRTAVGSRAASGWELALRRLARLSDPVSEKMLLDALKNASPGTSYVAAIPLRERVSAVMMPELVAAYRREKESKESMEEGSIFARVLLLDAIAKSGHPNAAEAVKIGLDDPASMVRIMALGSLERMGKPAVPALLRGLASAHPETRIWAMRALKNVLRREAVRYLLRLLSDPDGGVRTEAAVLLAELDSQAGIDLLRQVCRREGAKNRSVLIALAHLGDGEARSLLMTGLSHRDPLERARASSGIGLAGLVEAVPTLRQAAERDPSAAVRISATTSLASITGRREPLLAMLKDADEWNRLTAARLLLEQGDLSGRPVLLNALGSPDPALRLEAARLAGRFLTQDEAWRLEDLLRDSLDNVRLYAVQAAGQLRASELLPQLKAILEERRAGGYDLTAAAAEAIAAIGTGEAVSILREALKSEQSVTRLCAAVELIRMEQDRNRQAEKP